MVGNVTPLVRKVVIFDIDGTLADCSHRVHLVKKEKNSGKRDWKTFFEEAKNDKPHDHIITLCRILYETKHKVYLLTGRPEYQRVNTQEWLKAHSVPYDGLFMRPDTDRNPDFVTKKKTLEENLTSEEKQNIVCIFEDRLPVCKMWRENGYNVVVCGDEWLEGDWSE